VPACGRELAWVAEKPDRAEDPGGDVEVSGEEQQVEAPLRAGRPGLCTGHERFTDSRTAPGQGLAPLGPVLTPGRPVTKC